MRTACVGCSSAISVKANNTHLTTISVSVTEAIIEEDSVTSDSGNSTNFILLSGIKVVITFDVRCSESSTTCSCAFTMRYNVFYLCVSN